MSAGTVTFLNRPRTHRARPTIAVQRATTARRIVAVLAVIVVVFAIVGYRLVQVQVMASDRYVEFGFDQRSSTRELAVDRGPILDRDGNELALSVVRSSVTANPKLITEPSVTARQLAPLLGVPVADLTADLADAERSFVYLARKVDEDVAESIAALEIPGITFEDEPMRTWPADGLARSVVGFVGTDNVGLSGLELQYDAALSGLAGEEIVESDRSGRRIPTGASFERAALASTGLMLTLDRSLQFEAERVLTRAVEDTGARGGMAVISDPHSGDILAIANIGRDEDGEVGTSGNNLALTTVFEPGSVNKVITVAAALEEGLVEPASLVSVPDRLTVYDYTFSDHDPHATQSWTVNDIVTNSSNVGTILLAREVGADRLDRYLRQFGFGERTALDFPSESAGIMLDRENWSGTSIGAIPIGQGVAVTAMQMLDVYNTIANDGLAQPPRLVSGVTDQDGVVSALDPAEGTRVVSTVTATQLQAMLANVVESGTGTAAAIDGYTVAGKTGTARKPQATGGYADEDGRFDYVSTFAGFVPADDPQLSAIVVLDEPETSIYASETAAPVFAELAQFSLRHLGIAPADVGFAGVDVPEPSEGIGATEGNDISVLDP